MTRRNVKYICTRLQLPNGYMSIMLRHNEDYTNRWRKDPYIRCEIYKGKEFADSQRIAVLVFNSYREFKQYKDVMKTAK